jgi:enoyl-CoA hydratase/carnithine racemase
VGYEHIEVEADGPIVRVTLARPERRNALSLDTMGELVAAVRGLPDNAAVVVIAAQGTVFSAGHDIAEMTDRDAPFYDRLFAACTELMLALHSVPQPVIARVQGPATAAGCQLVAACDLAVASTAAWFATPGVKIGLFCSTPMVPVVRLVGQRRALQMLLTGEPIDAPTALAWGLVNQVVAPEDLDDAVDALAHQLLLFSPDVIGLGKRAFYSQVDLGEAAAYDAVRPVMAANAADADAQEGFTAFLAKRAPSWPGGRPLEGA